MSDGDTAIVWVRRDLRLTDNPALHAACERARNVVVVYVDAQQDEQPWAPGAASRWWLH
jgi:deoxyribodipyrimidine photo-lyase